MSGETLRRAAALMRERAAAATPTYEPVPARVDIDREGTCDACATNRRLVASYPEPDNEPWLCAECAAQADYEASWHPAVALAVADVLDGIVDDFSEDDDYFETDFVGRSLTLARAYLQETP